MGFSLKRVKKRISKNLVELRKFTIEERNKIPEELQKKWLKIIYKESKK